MRRRAATDWYALRDEVEGALRKCDGFPADAKIDGRLSRTAEGLNHENFVFRLEAKTAAVDTVAAAYILRKIRRDVAGNERHNALARLLDEAHTLQALATRQHDFDAPRFICFVGDTEASPEGFIETALPAVSMECIKKAERGRELVLPALARTMSAIHSLVTEDFGFLKHSTDSRSHLLDHLDIFDTDFVAHDADAIKVIDWVRSHLPENRPAVLLHGDMLPQNLLWDIDSERVGVVDWEYAATGDPAYDLAIVTRGNRNLFGLSGGVRRLLEAYRQAGGVPLAAADVMNWELLLVLRWLRESIEDEAAGSREGQPPEYYRNQLRAIFRRASGRRGS